MLGIGFIEMIILGLVCGLPLVGILALVIVLAVSQRKQTGLAPCPGCGKFIPPLSAVCPQCGQSLR